MDFQLFGVIVEAGDGWGLISGVYMDANGVLAGNMFIDEVAGNGEFFCDMVLC